MNSNIPEPETFCRLPRKEVGSSWKVLLQKVFFPLLYFLFVFFFLQFSVSKFPWDVFLSTPPPKFLLLPQKELFIEFQIPQMMYGSNVLWNTIIVRVLPATLAAPRPPPPPRSFSHILLLTWLLPGGIYWPQSVIATRLDSNNNNYSTTTNCRLLCKYDLLPSFLPLGVCGLGHGSSALLAHWLSPWRRMTAGIKFWGKWGRRGRGPDLDRMVVDPNCC